MSNLYKLAKKLNNKYAQKENIVGETFATSFSNIIYSLKNISMIFSHFNFLKNNKMTDELRGIRKDMILIERLLSELAARIADAAENSTNEN